MEHPTPVCCDEGMERIYSMRVLTIKQGTELWIERMEDIGLRENAEGKRRSVVHPRQVV